MKMKRFFALILAIALFAALLAPQVLADYQTGTYRITPDNGVNLRSGAGTKYDKVGAIGCGAEVKVTQVSGNWGKTSAGGKTGWFLLDNAKYVAESGGSEGGETAPAFSEGTYLVTAALSLREGPATSSKKLVSIPDGAVITLSEVSGSWGKTTYGGKTGWVNTAYLKAYEERSAQASDVYAIGYSTALKKEADAASDTLVTLPLNAEVTVTEIKGGWGRTTYKSYTGWFNLANAGAKLKDSPLVTGDQRKDMIAIALNELGKTNGSKYTFGRGNVAWCAYFVSWVARQAGVPTSVIKTAGYARAYSHGVTYYPRDKYLPSPGDLVYFDWPEYAGDMNHVGIVEEVMEDGSIGTVEGNTSGTVARRTYGKSSSASYRAYTSISYYGVPDYTTSNAKPVKTVKAAVDDKGNVKISWKATDASYYDVYVLPAKGSGIGDSILRARTTASTVTFGDMAGGSYKCLVYARPGSTAASAASEPAAFTVKREEAPATEEPSSEKPPAEDPSDGQPPETEPAAETPPAEEKTYELTVKNGTGSGSYKEGEKVTVTASDPGKGKAFRTWKSSGKGSFADAFAAKTTFTMPAEAVTVTAVFEDVPESPYQAGETYELTAEAEMRKAHDASAALLVKVPKGTRVKPEEVYGEWGRIAYEGKTGWISLKASKKAEDEKEPDVPETPEGAVYKAAATLNLREKATVSSTLLLKIPEGTKITITDYSGKWGKTTYNGKTGWVNLDFADQISSGAKDPAPGDGTIYRAAERLNLREKATVSSALLLRIPAGTKIAVKETSGKWGKTTYNGKTGWVNLDFAEKVSTSPESPEEPAQPPAEDPAPAKETVVEAATTLNLREKPTASSTLLLKIPEGTKVTVGERSGKWAKTTYNGKTGWVNLDFTRKPTEGGAQNPPAEDPAPAQETVVEAATTLNLREKPTASSTLLLKIPEGTKVTVGERSGKWAKATYNGKTGWVNLDFAEKVSGSGSGDSSGASGKAYVTTADLSLRADKTTSSKRLLVIPDGTKITITEISGKWGKTTYNGKTGWVYMDYVKKS